jgi:hypothetical protein
MQNDSSSRDCTYGWLLVTLFATDARLSWRSRKSTTTRQPIKVDSNFTCEYDAEGYFPGRLFSSSADVRRE